MISIKQVFTGFMAFLISLSLLMFMIIPDQSFSSLENRYLQENPDISWKAIKSGQYMSELSMYIKDQFAFKNQAVFLKGFFDEVFLKQENNNVFIGSEGQLFQKYIFNEKLAKSNISMLNDFLNKNSHLDISFLLVPNASEIYPENLPAFAVNDSQVDFIKYFKNHLETDEFVDIFSLLKSKKDEYIYFKTDHHWTMRGAYYGYQSFCKANNIIPDELDTFYREVVADNFYGSNYYKVMRQGIEPDLLESFYADFMKNINVKYEDSTDGHIFDLNQLDSEEKYGYFIGGNHALVTLENPSLKNTEELLILKDSYAHAMIPYLTNHYSKIHVIDTRYFKLSVQEYIEANNIAKILLVYNVDFINSTKLPKIY